MKKMKFEVPVVYSFRVRFTITGAEGREQARQIALQECGAVAVVFASQPAGTIDWKPPVMTRKTAHAALPLVVEAISPQAEVPRACPFCEERAAVLQTEIEAKAGLKCHVQCLNDVCRAFGPDGETPEDAIEKWNTRGPLPSPDIPENEVDLLMRKLNAYVYAGGMISEPQPVDRIRDMLTPQQQELWDLAQTAVKKYGPDAPILGALRDLLRDRADTVMAGKRHCKRLARRDRKIAGLKRKVERLEHALAWRTVDLESLTHNLRREVQDALCNVRMIPVGGPSNANRIVEVRNIPQGDGKA